MRSILYAALASAFAIPTIALAEERVDPDSIWNFDEVEIRTQEIAPGVAVLFGAGGNIGVSYGSDGVLIVDDQFEELTPKIQAAIAELGAGPVRFVINTHWHFDHAGGNENFGSAGATIFAHENIRLRLLNGGVTAGNEIPPAPPEALPVVTFEDRIQFHFNDDTIDAIFTGGGHTDGDTVIYWREANVLHTGDLMMNGRGFPFIDHAAGGTVESFIASLDRLVALANDQTIIVPGHGEVTDKAGLAVWRDQVSAAAETVREMVARGASDEDIKASEAMQALTVPGGFIPPDLFLASARVGIESDGN